MRWFAVILAAALLPSLALADAMKGAQLSASCAHCHGTDGNSSSNQYPTLAGQTQEYIARQIKAFKDGRRKDPMMSPMVGILTEQDMQDLGDFYSSQSAARGSFKPDPAQVAAGKTIVEEAKCSACHGPTFRGVKEFPRLTRQKYPYLVKQMKSFRDGTRTNDDGVMAATVKSLTDEQIDAIAQYLCSL